jgi:outer membrane immunogenic protein
MLKKLLISTAAAATMAGSALAADLPHYKAPPPPPPLPVFTWTGFYIGVNGGYIDKQGIHVIGTPLTTVPIGTNGFFNPIAAAFATGDLRRVNGGLGGGQVGYNWQANQYVVVGGEADIDGVFTGNRCDNNNFGFGGFGNNCGTTIVRTSAPNPVTGTVLQSTLTGNHRLSWISTIRGRFGVLPLPNVLVYATGGLAVGGTSYNVAVNQQLIGPAAVGVIAPYFANLTQSQTRVGFAGGFGVEWMFLPGWSLKAEALYYDLGTNFRNGNGNGATLNNIAFAPAAFPGVPFTSSLVQVDNRVRGVIARAGVNYHFTWGLPAPVVARY